MYVLYLYKVTIGNNKYDQQSYLIATDSPYEAQVKILENKSVFQTKYLLTYKKNSEEEMFKLLKVEQGVYELDLILSYKNQLYYIPYLTTTYGNQEKFQSPKAHLIDNYSVNSSNGSRSYQNYRFANGYNHYWMKSEDLGYKFPQIFKLKKRDLTVEDFVIGQNWEWIEFLNHLIEYYSIRTKKDDIKYFYLLEGTSLYQGFYGQLDLNLNYKLKNSNGLQTFVLPIDLNKIKHLYELNETSD